MPKKVRFVRNMNELVGAGRFEVHLDRTQFQLSIGQQAKMNVPKKRRWSSQTSVFG